MSWNEQALSLAFGASRKVRCCGEAASAYISNSPAGTRFGPCFRCGHKEFIPHKGVSIKQLHEWRAVDNKLTGSAMPALSPPEDWPDAVLVWLGRAGISLDTAQEMGAGWAESSARFILPCAVDGAKTGAFTGRSLVKDRPKYVQGGQGLATWIGGPRELPVVFVEDILSAWRVAGAGCRACAVLGTSFPQGVLKAALSTSHAISWLDPDKAGRAAHKKLRGALSLWDVDLKRVRSERDPKLHSKEQIIQYITEAA